MILGGDLISKAKLFGELPERVYTNGSFDTYDLHNTNWDTSKIHSLSDFDESIISDPTLRRKIADEKKKNGSKNQIDVVKTEQVNRIDFLSGHFLITGFLDADHEDGRVSLLARSRIESAGGTIERSFVKSVNYLIVPDHEIVSNSNTKKAKNLKNQGRAIAIINASECLKHANQYFANLLGKENYINISDYEFYIKERVITLRKYYGNEDEVFVPGEIGEYSISLAKETFSDNGTIKRITLSEGINELPKYLFSNCSELVTAKLNEGLRRIDDNAFYWCSNLSKVNIPSTVEYLGSNVFDYCQFIKTIDVPESVKDIHVPLTEISQFENITVNPLNSVFDSRENCNAIIETKTNKLIAGCKNTVIPAGITSIGDYAFKTCQIKELHIPEGVIEIGVGAFYGCKELKQIFLPSTLRKINHAAFMGSGINRIDLPEGMTVLDAWAFRACHELREITIPDSLKNIQNLKDLSDTKGYYGTVIKKVYGNKNSMAEEIATELKCEYVII